MEEDSPPLDAQALIERDFQIPGLNQIRDKLGLTDIASYEVSYTVKGVGKVTIKSYDKQKLLLQYLANQGPPPMELPPDFGLVFVDMDGTRTEPNGVKTDSKGNFIGVDEKMRERYRKEQEEQDMDY